MVQLSSTREVADFIQADQFQRGKTQFGCGFFAVAICKAMARVGKPPTQSEQQIIAEALAWYAQFNGNDSSSNTKGMSTGQLYDLLLQVGLHFQSTAANIAVVKAWVAAGYAVITAIVEGSVHDLELGDQNPYPWKAAGNHIIVISGNAKDGKNVLARDAANCTDLYDPDSLRPGPRTYDAAKLQIISATVVVPPGMPRPASATPPVNAPIVNKPIIPTPPPLHTWVSAGQEAAALAEWNSTAHMFGGTPPPYNTEIALEWQKRYRAKEWDGPPISLQYEVGNWPETEILLVQQFSRRRLELSKIGVKPY